jgi:hypothetical protein
MRDGGVNTRGEMVVCGRMNRQRVPIVPRSLAALSAFAAPFLVALLLPIRSALAGETARAPPLPPDAPAAPAPVAAPKGSSPEAPRPALAAPTPPNAPSPASAGAAPAAPSGPQAGAAPPAEPSWGSPSFSSDPIGSIVNATDLTLKMYGDTGFAVRNNSDQPWPANPNANAYAPGVWNSFYAPRLDLFGAADAGKLSFLTEVMFEAADNGITLDVERLQLSYLFTNWLRVRAGRTHLAWGYYNDTYHHGNFFELTTSRPFGVNFEDSGGIVLAHNVGLGIDGTFDLGRSGAIRYDAEVGNGRAADVTSVPLQFGEKNEKDVNVRLRWMPIDGLILGINGMRDVVPSLAGPAGGPIPTRPETEELVGGAHAVYTEHHFLVDVEGFAMRHNPVGAESTSIYGAFAELGYTIGAFTPYLRGEYLRFPANGDIVYQYGPDSAEGALSSRTAIYNGVQDFTDLRVGIKWLPLAQLALKLEGERLGRGSQNQEIATVKAAFGF